MYCFFCYLYLEFERDIYCFDGIELECDGLVSLFV